MRPNYVHLGILALFITFSLAFISSFLVWGRFNDYFHIVTQLYRGSSVYNDLASQVAWYGIAPITISLVLSVAAFAVERKFPTDSSFSVPFFVFALPCMLWGAICLAGTFSAYSSSIRMSNAEYNGSMNNNLVSLYQLAGLTGVLWLVTGTVLILLARKSEAI